MRVGFASFRISSDTAIFLCGGLPAFCYSWLNVRTLSTMSYPAAPPNSLSQLEIHSSRVSPVANTPKPIFSKTFSYLHHSLFIKIPKWLGNKINEHDFIIYV